MKTSTLTPLRALEEVLGFLDTTTVGDLLTDEGRKFFMSRYRSYAKIARIAIAKAEQGDTLTVRGWIDEGDLRLHELPPGVRLIIDNYDDVNMNDHPDMKIRVISAHNPKLPDEDGFFQIGKPGTPFRRMVYGGD